MCVCFGKGFGGGRCCWFCLACMVWHLRDLGSFCFWFKLLWKLSCIDFFKKLFQMRLGKELENSSFWHSSSVLNSRMCMWAHSQEQRGPSLLLLLLSKCDLPARLAREQSVRNEKGLSTSIALTKLGLIPNLPMIKWGLCKHQLFWDALQCSVTADKEGVLTSGSVPNPINCKNTLSSSTHTCKIVS